MSFTDATTLLSVFRRPYEMPHSKNKIETIVQYLKDSAASDMSMLLGLVMLTKPK